MFTISVVFFCTMVPPLADEYTTTFLSDIVFLKMKDEKRKRKKKCDSQSITTKKRKKKTPRTKQNKAINQEEDEEGRGEKGMLRIWHEPFLRAV